MDGFVPGQAPKNLAVLGTLPVSPCSLPAADRLGMLRHFPAVACWTHILSPMSLGGVPHRRILRVERGVWG